MARRPSPEQAITEHGPLVWSLCRRLADEPEDAYQESWERVIRGLPTWDPAGPAKLSTWIAVITHRVIVAPARPEHGLDLERALDRLPEVWRRVVVLHHVAGLSLEEIAATEGVAVGTIKSRLHRARGALVALLGGA